MSYTVSNQLPKAPDSFLQKGNGITSCCWLFPHQVFQPPSLTFSLSTICTCTYSLYLSLHCFISASKHSPILTTLPIMGEGASSRATSPMPFPFPVGNFFFYLFPFSIAQLPTNQFTDLLKHTSLKAWNSNLYIILPKLQVTAFLHHYGWLTERSRVK